MNIIDTGLRLLKKGTGGFLFLISFCLVIFVIPGWFDSTITTGDKVVITIPFLLASFLIFLLARFLYKSSTQTTLNIPMPMNIPMLGPSGVGKTSLLAAIYDQFDKITNLQIKSEDESKKILDNRLEELKSLVKQETIKASGGIYPTGVVPPKFLFDIGLSSSYWKIAFQDYPGEFIQDSKNITKVEIFLKESTAVLLAIDTPSLMEREGKWHDEINKPDLIRKLFKDAYQNLDSPRLVILALVKCEKYVRNEKDAKKLLECVKQKYENLLSLFRQGTLENKIAVVITPVQTVGSVIFSRIDTENGKPIFHFHKSTGDGSYSPKDCDQPLRYLFRFLLKNYPRDPLFTKNSELKTSVVNIATGCKNNTGGFEVVQGAGLL